MFISGSLPTPVSQNLNVQYKNFDGSTSTLAADFSRILDSFVDSPNLTASTAVAYGSIPDVDFDNLYNNLNYNFTNVYGVNNVDFKYNDLSAAENDPWLYANFEPTTGDNYSGYSFYYVVTNFATGSTPSNNAYFYGTISGLSYTYSGTCNPDINNLVVATIRSRGISLYDSSHHGPTYQVDNVNNLNTYYIQFWS